VVITTTQSVVNIPRPRAKTSNITHCDLPRAINNKKILHAKLQGANHAKNAINRLCLLLEFLFFSKFLFC
jgi:hypothetical protein